MANAAMVNFNVMAQKHCSVQGRPSSMEVLVPGQAQGKTSVTNMHSAQEKSVPFGGPTAIACAVPDAPVLAILFVRLAKPVAKYPVRPIKGFVKIFRKEKQAMVKAVSPAQIAVQDCAKGEPA